MVNQQAAKGVNQRMQQIDKMTIDALTGQPTHGENPEIFFYQFLDIHQNYEFYYTNGFLWWLRGYCLRFSNS